MDSDNSRQFLNYYLITIKALFEQNNWILEKYIEFHALFTNFTLNFNDVSFVNKIAESEKLIELVYLIVLGISQYLEEVISKESLFGATVSRNFDVYVKYCNLIKNVENSSLNNLTSRKNEQIGKLFKQICEYFQEITLIDINEAKLKLFSNSGFAVLDFNGLICIFKNNNNYSKG